MKKIEVRYLKDEGKYAAGKEIFKDEDLARDVVERGVAEFVVSEVPKKKKKETYVEGVGMIEEKTDETIDPKEILRAAANEQEIDDYLEGKIGWLEEEFYDTWGKVKGHMRKMIGHNETYDVADKIEPMKKFFLAHSKDTIRGKPQLVDQTQILMPLIKEMITPFKDEEKNEKKRFKYMFFDDKVDGRTKSYPRGSFAMDFRVYAVVDKDDKQYIILSQEKLPNCSCEFKGMIVDVEYTQELKKNFGVKNIQRVFVLKEFIPSVTILSKEKIVEFTKTREMTIRDWRDFLDIHPNGNFNRFVPEINDLRDVQMLSGKRDGYPFHLIILGPPGTGKSMGHLETLDFKFHESPNILEGGNSRIKMLGPSFKEKPANIGFFGKAERMAFVDEVGKMVEFELNKHQTQIQNILGECNFLYDHKERLVGSGNDNECKVQATSKNLLTSNAVSNKPKIHHHAGIIDPTFLSRNFIMVQDKKEQEFIFSGKFVERIPPHTFEHIYIEKEGRKQDKKEKKSYIFLYVRGEQTEGFPTKFSSREEFLTLFDTCNSFTCDVDEEKIKKLCDEITLLAKEPMKSSVWKPRGEHHIYLLVDGLCKRRCLFEDYDPSFSLKQEDYDAAERVLIRMVNSWDTDMSPREENR